MSGASDEASIPLFFVLIVEKQETWTTLPPLLYAAIASAMVFSSEKCPYSNTSSTSIKSE